jgi:hypothetical protein
MTVDDVIDENSPEDKPSGPGPSSVSLAESVARALEPSLCVARCDIASVALADGVYSRSFEGNGLVLHHDPFGSGIGLVAVDRNTVPISSCDVLLTFAAYPHEIAGAVEFLHPTKNFALVSYDAKQMPCEARKKVRAGGVRDRRKSVDAPRRRARARGPQLAVAPDVARSDRRG